MSKRGGRATVWKRQRKAAYRALNTMRHARWLRRAENMQHIDEFMTISKISKLKHPEIEDDEATKTRYAKGIVSLFHKTPVDIACGKFWELRWAYGCPLDCSYCYLRGTMRGNMKPSPLKPEHILNAIDESFINITQPSIFNTGELSDSLMYPNLMEKIVDRFEQQSKHKVALLSKMGKT